MAGEFLWGVVGLIGAGGAAALFYLKSKKQKSDSARAGQTGLRPHHSPAAPAAVSSASGGRHQPSRKIVLSGATPDHTGRSELDMELDEGFLYLHLHPPGKHGAFKMTIKAAELQRALSAGQHSITQRGNTQKLDFRFPADDPSQIPAGEICIQLGTLGAQRKMYVAEKELKAALSEFGITMESNGVAVKA